MDGRVLKLTAGGQNELVKRIIENFCPRFTSNTSRPRKTAVEAARMGLGFVMG